MEHLEVKNVEHSTNRIVLHVQMKRRACCCPVCQTVTEQVHDYRTQQVKDCPIQGKHLVWVYRRRRYRCSCCGKRFCEINHLVPKWHRITNRLVAQCIGMFNFKQSRKEIARSLGISESTVGRWLTLIDYGKPQLLPKVLSIDEFKGDTEYGKYQCILTSPVDKRIVDILPTRYSSQLYDYLQGFPNRKQVKYIVMDMNKEYLRIAKQLLPQATVVVDRFHVVRHCTWALENVRKRVQKKLPQQQRIHFKRSRKLLLSHMDMLSAHNKAAVERMLLVSHDLREAYLLKEIFYKFMASPDSTHAKQRLHEFRLHASLTSIPEFDACLTMLQNWESYILNAFDSPYSNGFTEGVNNTVKVIKRIAYGYRNFRNFRARILATVNA
jgi:transposase